MASHQKEDVSLRSKKILSEEELRKQFPSIFEYCASLNSKLFIVNQQFLKIKESDKSKYTSSYFKSLDSSLKKNTSIVNKLKSNNFLIDDEFIEEIKKTNVSHYLTEIINDIFDNEDLLKHFKACTDIFVHLSTVYNKFNGELIKICDSRLSNLANSDPKNLIFIKYLLHMCIIQIFDLKTCCQKIVDILKGICKNPKLSIIDVLKILNYAFSDSTFLLLGHHQLKIQNIISKKFSAIIDGLISEMRNFEPLPEKLHKAIDQIMKEFHQNKLESYISEEKKSLEKYEYACKTSLQTKGEVSRKLTNDYDSKLDFMNILRTETLKYCQLFHLTVKQFSEDEELNDVNEMEPNSDDLMRMFGTEQDIEFYKHLIDLSPYIKSMKIDRTISIPKEDTNNPDSTNFIDTDSKSFSNIVDQLPVNDCHPSMLKNTLSSLSTSQKDTSEFSSFISRLMNCYNKDIIDEHIVKFLTKFNSNSNIKKLMSTFLLVPASRLDLLPFFCRFIATYQQVNSDFTSNIINKNINSLYRSIGAYDRKLIESKIKTITYIGELIKFSLVSPIRILNMFRNSKTKLTEIDVELICILFNCAGQFIYNHPAYHNKAKLFLESLFRVKTRLATNRDLCTLIDEAYYRIFDHKKQNSMAHNYTVMQRFIQHLIYDALNNSNIERTALLLNSIPENDTKFIIETLTSPWNIVKSNIPLITQLIINISELNPLFEIRCVHRVIEMIYSSLITNSTSNLFHRISCIELLIEFYKYECFDDNLLYTLLGWHFRLGIDPFILNSYSICDPASDLFRFKCASIIIRDTVEYLDSENSDYFNLMIAYYQLYYRYKHDSSVWIENPSQSQINSDFLPSNDSHFPIECEQLFTETIKKCKKYFIFDLLETYEKARIHTFKLQKMREEQIIAKSNIGSRNKSIEDPSLEADNNSLYKDQNKKIGKKLMRRLGHQIRQQDDEVIKTDKEKYQEKLVEFANQQRENDLLEFDGMLQQIVAEETRVNSLNKDRSAFSSSLTNSTSILKSLKVNDEPSNPNEKILVSRTKNNTTIGTKIFINDEKL